MWEWIARSFGTLKHVWQYWILKIFSSGFFRICGCVPVCVGLYLEERTQSTFLKRPTQPPPAIFVLYTMVLCSISSYHASLSKTRDKDFTFLPLSTLLSAVTCAFIIVFSHSRQKSQHVHPTAHMETWGPCGATALFFRLLLQIWVCSLKRRQLL